MKFKLERYEDSSFSDLFSTAELCRNYNKYILLDVFKMFTLQAANIRGFRASMKPRFEGGIPDFIDGIPNFM